MKSTKVLIQTRGGIIQNITSNNPDSKFVIVDWDETSEDEVVEDFINQGILDPDLVQENMWEAIEASTPSEIMVRTKLQELNF